MGVSNSLEAVRLGFDFVDSSLQGLGRSSGNAATEILVAALLKLGYELNIDFIKLLEIGFKYINPMVVLKGEHPLDVIAGFADFHTSYMHCIGKYSAKYSINPALLIIEVCRYDKVNVNEEIMEEIAMSIRDREGLFAGNYEFERYVGNEQDNKEHGRQRAYSKSI
jgi:isopropylmalate/homocitrate/citramalate synthase